MKKIIVLLLIISSCKKEVYYYPSKKFFDEREPKEIIIDDLSFEEITDSISNGLFRKERYFVTLEDSKSIFKISPFTYTGGYIKEKNILEIVDDSLWFLANKVSIIELGKHIKLHYENNGGNTIFTRFIQKSFYKIDYRTKG